MLFSFFSKYYDKKINSIGLAIFRIVYFSILLIELGQLLYFKEIIFDKIPFVQPSEFDVQLLLWVWLGVAAALLLGLFTATMTKINYIFSLIFFASLSSFDYPAFGYYTTINFLCLILPISQRLSLDRLGSKLKYSTTKNNYQPPTNTSVFNYLVPIFMLLVWFYATIIFSQNRGITIKDDFLLMGSCFLAYFSLIYGVVFIFLFWCKSLRAVLLVLGLGLHFFYFWVSPMPLFFALLMAIHILLIPSSWYSKIGRFLKASSPHLWIYYDEECPLCVRTKIIVKHFDIFHRLEFRGVQTFREDAAIQAIPLADLLENIYSVNQAGKVQKGIDSYIQILLSLGYTKPKAWLLKIPGIYHLAKAFYNFIAKNRNVERCSEKTCGYLLPSISSNRDKVKLLKNLTVKKFKIMLVGTTMIALLGLELALLVIDKGGLSEAAKITLGYANEIPFQDNFATNTRLVRVYYFDENQQKIYLPITQKNGSPASYIYGLRWHKWLKESKEPKKLKRLVFNYIVLEQNKKQLNPKSTTFVLETKANSKAVAWSSWDSLEWKQNEWKWSRNN